MNIDKLLSEVHNNSELSKIYNSFKWTDTMSEWKKIKEDSTSLYGIKNIVLFQVGNFYEAYFYDAHIYAKLLNQILTKKSKKDELSAPMSGSPIFALDSKIKALTEAGLYVIIVSETEKSNKGFKREVSGIYSPSKNLNLYNKEQNNIVSILGDSFILTDLYSSVIYYYTVRTTEEIYDLLKLYNPKEILSDIELNGYYFINNNNNSSISAHNKKDSSFYASIEDTATQNNIKYLLNFIENNLKINISFITKIEPLLNIKDNFVLDNGTINNLEIFSQKEGKEYSFFSLIDSTQTHMGNRFLKNLLLNPYKNKEKIEARLNMIEAVIQNINYISTDIKPLLINIADIERLSGKISQINVSPLDIQLILNSLEYLTILSTKLKNSPFSIYSGKLHNYTDLLEKTKNTLKEVLPSNSKDGDIFKRGFSDELDRILDLHDNTDLYLRSYQDKYRDISGIKNLKVIDNTLGFFIEVNHLDTIPDNWFKARSTINKERYSTPDLDNLYNEYITSDVRKKKIEYDLFQKLRLELVGYVSAIQEDADIIANIDVYIMLAQLAIKNKYIKPKMNSYGGLNIINGWNPLLQNKENIIKNNVFLNEIKLKVLTGPNMGGKSVYLKMTGLIVLLAHIGSYVPAEFAEISIIDNIYVRAGAADNIAKNQSTFFLEMNETSNILYSATKNSLILLDEIGRGTDSKDGYAISLAIIKYLNKLGVKTILASHYHDLIGAIHNIDATSNIYVEVLVNNGNIEFTHKIIEGIPQEQNSYGIEIAKLAGIPINIIDDALKIKNNP